MLKKGLLYSCLDKSEKTLYELLLHSFSNRLFEIECGRISSHIDLMKVIEIVLADNPEVIYFDKTQIWFEDYMKCKKIKLKKISNDIDGMESELKEALDIAYRKVLAYDNDSLYHKIKHIYEYLQKNIKYDDAEKDEFLRGKIKNLCSHNAYGALVNGKAVCDGISAAFSLICQKMKINCISISGMSSYLQGKKVVHTWNIVEINQVYFHFDATWDINVFADSKVYSYEYFGLQDEEIYFDHVWDKNLYPICNSNVLSYYVVNNSYIYDLRQLEKYLYTVLKSKPNIIRFKLCKEIFRNRTQFDDFLCNKVLEIADSFSINRSVDYFWNEDTGGFLLKFK